VLKAAAGSHDADARAQVEIPCAFCSDGVLSNIHWVTPTSIEVFACGQFQ